MKLRQLVGPLLLLVSAVAAVFGLLLLLIRTALSILLSFLNISLPAYTYPLFLTAVTGLFVLFPSFSGRILTLLASKFGLLKLRIDKVDVRHLTLDGIVVETRQIRVTVRSIGARFDRHKGDVYVKVGGGHVEMLEPAAQPVPRSAAALAPKPKKSSSSSSASSLLMMLRFIDTVHFECDALHLSSRFGSIRTRDLSLSVKTSNDRRDRRLNFGARVQAKVAVGMLSVTLGLSALPGDLSSKRLGETDDLFPEGTLRALHPPD
jgi:hypothetical protein